MREIDQQDFKDYLDIYVGKADWDTHFKTLWTRGVKGDREKFTQAVCCAILLPSVDRSTHIDPQIPENLLLKVPYFQQLGQRNWRELFENVLEQDEQIKKWRMESLGLGVIEPIEFAPNTRQAFNWLFIRAEETGAVTPETKADIKQRFTNLVLAYGGAVICNIFTRHEKELKKVVNWRTGYFFERVIFEVSGGVYSPEQVMKIKKKELDETNERLVRRLRG